MSSSPVDEGIALREEQRFDAALASFREAITRGVEPARAWFQIGVTHQERSELDAAEAAFRQAIELQPDYRGAWGNLGVVLLRRKSYARALRCFDHLLALNPNDWRSHANRCDALAGNGRVPQAREALDRALELASDAEVSSHERAELHVRAAKINIQAGNLDAAVREADAALRAHPNHVEALNCRGWLWDHGGDYERALGCFEQALAIAPRDNAGRQNMGCTYLHLRSPERALPYLEAVLAGMPDAFEAHYNMACAHAQLGHADTAVELLRKAEQLAPHIPVRMAASNDPDLANLAGNEVFEGWLERDIERRNVSVDVPTPASHQDDLHDVRWVLTTTSPDELYEQFRNRDIAPHLSRLLRDEDARVRLGVALLADDAIDVVWGETEGCYDEGGATFLYDYVRGLVVAFDDLIALLRDDVSEVRATGARSLGQLAFALNEKFVRGPEYKATRAQLRAGLLRAVEPLIAATTDAEPAVRAAAVGALGRFTFVEAERVVPSMRHALRESSPAIRLAGATALSEHRGVKATDDLASIVDDPDIEVARFAVNTLVDYDQPVCVPALLRQLQTTPCDEVVVDVQRMGVAEAMPLLRDLVDRSSETGTPWLLRPALEALIEIGDASCIPVLRRVLSHDDQLVRQHAVLALARLRATDAVAEIADLLPKAIALHRAAESIVATALARIGDVSVCPALLHAYCNPNAEAVDDYLEALALLGSSEALNPIRGRVGGRPTPRRVLALGHLGNPSEDIPLVRSQISHTQVGKAAAMATAMLNPGMFDPNIAELIESPTDKALRIETFEETRLAWAYAWRTLAQRAVDTEFEVRRYIAEVGLRWVAACRAGLDGALACFHRRGCVVSTHGGVTFIIDDVTLEAEAELRRLA